MTEYIEATPANMRRYPGLIALDRSTGEKFSANASDYFWLAEGKALTNEDGEALILAVAIPARAEPFTPTEGDT